MYPHGNLYAIDSHFFGVSTSTESGLNPVDIKALETYQQIFIYITPIVTNLGLIDALVVVCIVTSIPDALRENQKQATARNADMRNMEGGLTGETAMPKKILITQAATQSQLGAEGSRPMVSHISSAPDPQRGDAPEKGVYIPGP
ncbi:potassium ion transmembrane transporter [Ascochyta rabiei]|uniref:Potassium ion transmembrane transporter n=2 Tax=Didymella rabiei TaxID=5454 RepID=A0A163M2W4_DIDRA|nr:potassium ion transmembrane transporter [Ascochyta rabiei]